MQTEFRYTDLSLSLLSSAIFYYSYILNRYQSIGMYDIQCNCSSWFFLNLWSIALWLIFIGKSNILRLISKFQNGIYVRKIPPISKMGTMYKRHIKLVKVKEHLIRLQIDDYCLIEIDDTDLKKIWKRLNWKRTFAEC